METSKILRRVAEVAEATSCQRQATSNKQQELKATSYKQQELKATSYKQQATSDSEDISYKHQATSSKHQET